MAEHRKTDDDDRDLWSIFDNDEIAQELKFWQRATVRIGILLNGAGIAACLGALGALGALAGGNGPPKIIALPIGVFLFGIFAGLLVGLGNMVELFWEAGKRGLLKDKRPKNPIVVLRFSKIIAGIFIFSVGFFALGSIISLGLILAW